LKKYGLQNLVRRFYVDDAVLNTRAVIGHRCHGREAHGVPASYVESSAMARTFNFIAINDALLQRAAVVSANVGNSMKFAVDVEDDESFMLELEPTALSFRNIFYFANFNELRH
jgi:hypothetical protein